MVRTYAPRGQTPELRVPLTRDHLSVISGITEAGRLLVRMQDRAYKGKDVVVFLKHIVRCLASTVLVIWDGAPIHHDGQVKAFLASEGGAVQLEQLPAYAPELNPDEAVWDQLKYVELRNTTCHDQDELRHELRRAITRLQHKPELIRSFVEHCGY